MDKYEKAARRFLELQGRDPNAQGPIPCPDGHPGCCVAHYGPQWMAYVDEAKREDLWKRAFSADAQ